MYLYALFLYTLFIIQTQALIILYSMFCALKLLKQVRAFPLGSGTPGQHVPLSALVLQGSDPPYTENVSVPCMYTVRSAQLSDRPAPVCRTP